MSENNGKIIATYEIPFSTTKTDVWKFVRVAIHVVNFQSFEEKFQELLILEAGREVFDPCIIQEQLKIREQKQILVKGQNPRD